MLSPGPLQFLTSIFYITKLKEKSGKVNSVSNIEKEIKKLYPRKNFTVKFHEWNQGGRVSVFGSNDCLKYQRQNWSWRVFVPLLLGDASEESWSYSSSPCKTHLRLTFMPCSVAPAPPCVTAEVAAKRKRFEAGAPGRDFWGQCGLSENAVWTDALNACRTP